MSLKFVPLNRVFHLVSEKQLENVESLLSYADSRFNLGSLDWNSVLECPRVLILAQGGVGKTREMQEQAKNLNNENKAAFFLPLERLDDDPITEIIGLENSDRFETWLNHEDSIGWFFLDSVDELKTSQGTLERALQKFANALGRDALSRTRIILSCRPKDWSETIDRPAVQSILALPPSMEIEQGQEEDAFVASLKRNREQGTQDNKKEEPEGLKVIMMLPLDRKRTRQFAEVLGLPDVDAFMDEVTRRNADELIKRPMDLVTMIDMWRDHERLGTRREQIELNINSNLIEAEESQHQKEALSLKRAQAGVKRIALGMVLAKRSTIYAEAPSVGRATHQDAISAERILVDWGQDERAKLLRLPIFDLAALGQVRFHHRLIKDFLAAERLYELRQSNMSGRELRSLLIAEKFGETVMIPSMRDVAAWLALKDDRLRNQILQISPEVLIANGDPEALPVNERGALLSAFAAIHGQGNWRGLGFDITQLRRLSDPALGKVVRKIWNEGHENTEILDLLVDMIWHGPLADCADLAESIILDNTVDDSTRATAARALISFNKHDAVQQFVDEALMQITSWNGLSFIYLLSELVPDYLSPKRCVNLFREIILSDRTDDSLSWEVGEIAAKLPPLSQHANELRSGLSRLIEEGADDNITEYDIRSRFGKLTEPLASLCAHQIEAGAMPEAALVHDCIIASRFKRDSYHSDREVKSLAEVVVQRPNFRESLYWEDVAFLGKLFPERDSWWRAWRSSHESALIGSLAQGDVVWLEHALKSKGSEEQKLALHQLLTIWRDLDRPDDLLERMRTATTSAPELSSIIDDAIKPFEEPTELRESQKRLVYIKRAQRAKEHKRIADWEDWRHEIQGNPSSAFTGDDENLNIENLIKWLAMHEGRHKSDGPWSSDVVISVFGQGVYQHALPALKRYWRSHKPDLWSERKTEERSTYYHSWMYGLSALKAEAGEENWINKLSDNEVFLAVRYAMTQFNGRPEFLDDLISLRPNIVSNLLSEELEGQFSVWEEVSGDLPLLQSIRYGSPEIQNLLAPALIDLVERWPVGSTNTEQGRALQGLSNLIEILSDIHTDIDVSRLLNHAKGQFEADPYGVYATMWLEAVFKMDFETGVDLLTSNFQDPGNNAEEQAVIGFLAALFDNHRGTPIPSPQSSDGAEALGKLLRFSYNFVKREKDQVHHGSYSPDIRDNAETARSAIFRTLLEMPGAAARRIFLEFADEPKFAKIADRWRMLALEQVAIQAELEPYDATTIIKFEKQNELAPRDSEELLKTILGRLDDLAHDLHHHKFSPLKEWRSIDDESDAQRLLSARLDEKRAQVYTAVTREEEVAEQNRTDVTLSTLGTDAKQAVIEIKIANKNRPAKSLATDLEDQLVGKYLRHADCRSGCFLVVNRGDKSKWKHPETNKLVSFFALMNYLETKAQDIEKKHNYNVKLAVFGLDLTDGGKERHG